MNANSCGASVFGRVALVLVALVLVAAALAAAGSAAPARHAAAATDSATAGRQALDGEGLAVLLAAAGDAAARSDILRQLGTDGACQALTRFGGRGDPTVREQAVRAMSQAGCAAVEYYRPYMRDPHPWVTDALVTAIEQYRIGEAVPFLISHLSDPRRILSSGGTWTIGERAHRALRVVSCQSMQFDPDGTAQQRARAAARWTTWYAEHGGEPRTRWIEEGIARARQYIDHDGEGRRLEGLELLLLIGAPETPEMRAAFGHGPADLEISLECSPEEPPRVTEEVPCRFAVANRSERPIALIPGDLDVALRRQGADEDLEGAPTAKRSAPSSGARDLVEEMIEWSGRIVDLAPGDRLERRIIVGPVPAAGRYDVRATLSDLAARIVAAGGGERSRDGGAMEGRTVVWFNQ